MRILINGTTGLLGRNILFEILKQHINNLDDLEIIILDRVGKSDSLKQRIQNILLNDGFDYLSIAEKERNELLQLIMKNIILIDYDLTLPDLGINKKSMQMLSGLSIDYCYHIAALTNFYDSPGVIRLLRQINYEGTVKILSLIAELKIKRFCYISTVYSAGANSQEIYPDYINSSEQFRNPYEKSKLNAEIYLMDFARRHNIDYRIYRISIIAGRLIEPKIGSVCKFDVFYQFASFFLKYKHKILKSVHDLYNKRLEINLRIAMHPQSIMNICPADYGAKLIYYSSIAESDYNAFHIVNDTDINTNLVVNQIMSTLNISGYSFVNEIPGNQNPLEQLYYRSLGKVFTPYIIEPPLIYNNDNMQNTKEANNIACPKMDAFNFQKLLDYAKDLYFGLNL